MSNVHDAVSASPHASRAVRLPVYDSAGFPVGNTRTRHWFRPVSILLLVAMTGCSATRTHPNITPQDLTHWSVVTSVAPGTLLEVVLASGALERGELISVDDTTIALRIGPNLKTIPRNSVQEVAVIQRGPDSLKNGAIIGAAVAVGYAAIVLAIVSRGGESVVGKTSGVLITAGIGGAVGAWIDSARTGTRKVVIFRRDARSISR
jgi:hypothetical protein